MALSASAATSTVWEVSGFTDFLKGRLTNLSLTSDGLLQPGPSIRWSTPLDQPALWAIAPALGGDVFAATGHTGKVYRVTNAGKASVVWTAPQSEVFALATDPKGILFAGSSPNGSVYRIEGTNVRELWKAPAKYIWAIQIGAKGDLYIATGEPGRVYRLAQNATNAELFFDSGQSNITALALAPNGHVLAGSDPNGLVYDISAPGKASALYDSSLPEIRAIAVDSKGYVYVAAMGGALSTRTASGTNTATTSSTPAVATSPTVITVSDANEQSGVRVTTAGSPSGAQSSGTTSATVSEVTGVEKSAIYRISPGGSVETLRTSKEENVYDLILDGDDLLFSTDANGRIFRWHDHQTTMLSEPGNGESTRILKINGALYAAMSNPARLIAFSPAGSTTASYESEVHDSTSVARWGHLQWHGIAPAGISFRTRTGNTARPDSTWSAWSEPANSLIASPVARFIQWRAEWPSGSSAGLSTVDLPYLPRNGAPAVHSINVMSVLGATTNQQKSGNTAAGSSAAYSITVTDTGEAPAASSSSSATQATSRLQAQQTQITWQADDPDGDRLMYAVYFRPEEDPNWHLLRQHIFDNTLAIDPDAFADGRYLFRVVASDAPANAPEYALESSLVSSPVLIDNTPPKVTITKVTRTGQSLEVEIEAEDQASPLRLCEYSLDAGFWQPVEAVDGVTDSPHQRFRLHLETLKEGEHFLVVRAFDTSNNAGLARANIPR